MHMRAELEYVKREDVLDESGRQRPILIQSNESNLLEKLHINEFLYEAPFSKTSNHFFVLETKQRGWGAHSEQTNSEQTDYDGGIEISVNPL